MPSVCFFSHQGYGVRVTPVVDATTAHFPFTKHAQLGHSYRRWFFSAGLGRSAVDPELTRF
jgi:hypothetical protein